VRRAERVHKSPEARRAEIVAAAAAIALKEPAGHWPVVGRQPDAGRWSGSRVDLCHSGLARNRSFDVNVPFMQLKQRGWDIHAVSLTSERDDPSDSPLRE
jgi:hypothetical protein